MAVTRHRASLLPPAIADYIAERTAPPDDVLVRLQARTRELGRAAGMQIGADQGALLTLLTRLVGARRAVEIGTFTGFSALCVARGLPADGSLICLDTSAEWTAIARRYWERAGVADRIEVRLGDAHETVRALPVEPVLDLAFVDADKAGYADYLDQLHPRLRTDALVLLDNTLRSGKVLDPQDDDARAVAQLNAALVGDPRWETVLLPVSDGLTFLRKR